MILRAKKRLRACLKRKKNHVMVMFVCMDAVNTYAIRRMNMREHQQKYPSVRWESFWKCNNIIIKTVNIVLWLIKNHKYTQLSYSLCISSIVC